MAYTFRVTVARTDEAESAEPVEFTVENHDDILKILEMSQTVNRERLHLDEDGHRAFIVGLKLFGEVLIKHRKTEPFAGMLPAFSEFMKQYKSLFKD